MHIEIPSRFAGPPAMGHGGYIAGLLVERTAPAPGEAVQVTLRQPTPLEVGLEIVDVGDRRVELRRDDAVIADSVPTTLDLDVPHPPSAGAASAARPRSPSFYGGRGVHPTCFGCGQLPEALGTLRIAAAPVEAEGRSLVAGTWRPGSTFAAADGSVPTRWVLAALDCPGAFAFIVEDVGAGLLGRIVFEQFHQVRADDDHVAIGWPIGRDGRKLLAGTALFDPSGRLLAAARAVWFPFPSPEPSSARNQAGQ